MNYRVIKTNDIFLTTDVSGNIPKDDKLGLGLYYRDTRFLSRLEVTINGVDPVLLSSEDNRGYAASFRLTNPHMEDGGVLKLWRETVELRRERFIYDGVLYETVTFTNYGPKAVSFETAVQFEADFVDMFAVRGFQHGKLGVKQPTREGNGFISFVYHGSDQVTRQTVIECDNDGVWDATAGVFSAKLALEPRESTSLGLRIIPALDFEIPKALTTGEAYRRLEQEAAGWLASCAAVESDSPFFNRMYLRGLQDLGTLASDFGQGSFLVAGLPWYAVPFGRDSLIAALQMLPVNTSIARGTLRTLAALQGQEINEWKDEQPGKIMHEMRYGELANTGQVPFSPYFGTIDATPLFLLLLAEYTLWSGDFELIRELMLIVEQALKWIDEFGDRDGDQFVEYYQQSSKGIANQGWKDSADSVVHETGDLAEAPIALAEVQSYVFQAKRSLSRVFRGLGDRQKAEQLAEEAEKLRQAFEAEFWMEDLGFYAIALDKEKKQVRSVTSNPGHALMSGIMSPERALKVADRLIASDMFSGYGIRTMSSESTGYNPMSYHDGSVWPHDNSLILLGMSQSGYKTQAQVVMDGLIAAAEGFEYGRLPELFCGYAVNGTEAPVPYPVACSPQAWAAGTPLMMVHAMLGMRADALTQTISLSPVLPSTVSVLKVIGLQAGRGFLTLKLNKQPDGSIAVEIIENTTGYTLS